MEVSIVIPVFNQVHFTKICLASLWPTIPADAEIIVIDNGSSDGTAEYLSKFPRIRVFTNSENRGCASAWNEGVTASHADWVVILNNDVILSPNWLCELLHFTRERGVDIGSPAFREGEYTYDIEGYSRDFVCRMGSVTRIGIAQGICFMVHRRVFNRIGLFDENFSIGQFEDADFFRRAMQAGFSLGTTGRSFIHHFGSVTQNSIRREKTAGPYGKKNRAYYRKKHGLTLWKRLLERRRLKIRAAWWRISEKASYGHTLVEKLIDGRLRYF